MSSAILLYTTAILKKLAGIFKSSYKEKQTEDSHFKPGLSFKNVFNFLLTFSIIPYGFSPLPQKSPEFQTEDKAQERKRFETQLALPAETAALPALPAWQVSTLGAVRGHGETARLPCATAEDREMVNKEKRGAHLSHKPRPAWSETG